MGKQSTAKLLFVFSGLAIAAIIAVGTCLVLVRFRSIRTQAEKDAAVAASGYLTPILEPEAGDLSATSLATFAEAANGLLSDQIRTIRLWGSDGELLATTSGGEVAQADVAALARVAEGDVSSAKRSPPAGDVLVSYTAFGPGAALEVQQDYGPVAESIMSSRSELLLLASAGGFALIVLLPAAVWAAIGGLRSEYGRLLFLHRAGQAIRSTLDLSGVLEHLARDTAVFTDARLSLAALVEEETNDLVVKASFEKEANATAQHHRKVEAWFLRRCIGTGETIVAGQDDLPYGQLLGYEPAQRGPVSLLCAAIPGHERCTGVVMVVRNQEEGGFAAFEVQMVEEMAAQGAMAVEQALLFAKMRSYADQVEVSYDTTLKVLMAALDTKDAVTQGHSERVSQLTVATAREMGVPNERLVDMERGALLHDVGKIGVPDAVLRKPDMLNDLEWQAMQKHPLLSGLMVSKVGFLEGAMPILLYHHERYDGTGYPFGLEGTAIPLEARIFAVIDSYDAMTSERPYRKPMPPQAALREIQQNAGSQFDPQVVEAFTRVMNRSLPVLKKAS